MQIPGDVNSQLTDPSGSESRPTEGSSGGAAEQEFADVVKTFRDSGFSPDEARDAALHLAKLRTEDGQREYQAGLYSQAVQMLQQEASTPEGVRKLEEFVTRQKAALGLNTTPSSSTDDLLGIGSDPSDARIKNLEAQIAELRNQTAGVRQVSEDLHANQVRAAAFRDWKNDNRDLPPKAVMKLSAKFVERVRENPQMLRDGASVRAWFNRELSDYREVSQAFAATPKPSPVPSRSPIGQSSTSDRYKGITDPAKRLEAMMNDVASEIDSSSR